jgi:hypothetical protein
MGIRSAALDVSVATICSPGQGHPRRGAHTPASRPRADRRGARESHDREEDHHQRDGTCAPGCRVAGHTRAGALCVTTSPSADGFARPAPDGWISTGRGWSPRRSWTVSTCCPPPTRACPRPRSPWATRISSKPTRVPGHEVDPMLRPEFHRLESRIRAHVLICWLALLVRVAENATGPAGIQRDRRAEGLPCRWPACCVRSSGGLCRFVTSLTTLSVVSLWSRSFPFPAKQKAQVADLGLCW